MYAIWRACERFKIRPPNVEYDEWDKLDVISQANLIAYDQLREIETAKWEVSLASAKLANSL